MHKEIIVAKNILDRYLKSKVGEIETWRQKIHAIVEAAASRWLEKNLFQERGRSELDFYTIIVRRARREGWVLKHVKKAEITAQQFLAWWHLEKTDI
ncbi:MAG: hypothetical protein RJA61_331, partial [Candidatus Parcubacteria bacterium]